MKALIIGHYGGRNFGDELMLLGLVRLLGRRDDSAIRVQTPDGTISPDLRRLGVEAGYSRAPGQILKGIWWADTVVLGGGTMFHDGYPDERYRDYWRNLLALALIFTLARLLGRHVSLIGIGVGPLHRWRTRAFTTLIKLAANDITVRDRQSYDDLAALPGGAGKVTIADDLSGFVPLPEKESATRRLLGISLVPPAVVSGAEQVAVEAFYDALAVQVSEALGSGAFDGVMLISANVGKDSDQAVALQMLWLLGAPVGRVEHLVFAGDPLAFAQQIGRCSLVVAARYHVAVVARAMAVPTIWLAYQRKVADAAQNSGVAATDLFALSELCADAELRAALFARMLAAKGDAPLPREREAVDPTAAIPERTSGDRES